MKLHSVVLVMLFLGLIFSVLNDFVFCAVLLEQKADNAFQIYTAKRFIAESFRNTCAGKGFSNLEQWQNSCRALFKLESIEWNYVVDGTEILIQGSWQGNDALCECRGEAFCRNLKGR